MKKDNFKFVGLERFNGDIIATCENKNEDTFKAIINSALSDKEALWKYMKGNWGGVVANIQHEGLYKNGIPKEPILINIEHI
ncbi:MAG: hypothetical protein AABY22_04025 [Nanoarchaeota archaeon]